MTASLSLLVNGSFLGPRGNAFFIKLSDNAIFLDADLFYLQLLGNGPVRAAVAASSTFYQP